MALQRGRLWDVVVVPTRLINKQPQFLLTYNIILLTN